MTGRTGTTTGASPSIYARAVQLLRERECDDIAELRRRGRKALALVRERTNRMLWRPLSDRFDRLPPR